MRPFNILTAVTAIGTFAVPALSAPGVSSRGPSCMTASQAQKVANNFADLLTSYSNNLANEVLASDFTDYSDSVIELINSGCSGPDTLGTATFTSRAAFEAGQGGQPAIPFQQLGIWNTCDTVIIRWRSAQTPQEVTGVIILQVTSQLSLSQPYLIKTVYSEFNSGAWLVNLGIFKPTCPASSSKLLRA